MIFQFGTSRFLQAHVDLFAWEASLAGQKVPDIAIVQISQDAGRTTRLAAFNDPVGFPVIVRGIRNGHTVDATVQVKSVGQGLSASRDWALLHAIFIDSASYIVSNSGDMGYDVPPEDRIRPVWRAPRSFCGILVQLLHGRWMAGQAGVTIMPCELVPSNGATLQRHVSALAEIWALEGSFRHWLATQCLWVDTLVDRIVSEPLEPAGAVAEPYALWAIKDRPGLVLPFTHPAIILTPQLEYFERLKLHILNLGHSWLAEEWQAAGADPDATVLAFMRDDGHRQSLEDLYRREVLPGFAARGLEAEASDYIAETLERFSNPYLRHRLADIHAAHGAKIVKRFGGFVSWVDGSGQHIPMPRVRMIAARYEGQE